MAGSSSSWVARIRRVVGFSLVQVGTQVCLWLLNDLTLVYGVLLVQELQLPVLVGGMSL